MTTKFDIFPFLAKLNRGDFLAYQKLDSDDQKQVSAFTCMGFLSGTTDRLQVVLLNQFVNTYVFTLPKEQLFLLMGISTSGRVGSVKWPGQLKNSNTGALKVISEFYECSSREALLMVQNFTQDEVVAMAEQLGYAEDDLKKLKKA